MSEGRSPTLSLRASGPLACFTRPELKVERVSYPVMTPSAARGLIEAVLWKPAIRWRVERIKVLNEIRFVSFRRNEVKKKATAPSQKMIKEGAGFPRYFADQDRARTQRNTVALQNVDYVIDAHFEMTGRAGTDDNINKFVDMFTRRVAKGQHYHQPYLGCREFAARVEPADGVAPLPLDQDLGLMLWDIEFGKDKNRPIFFQARLENGVMDVPLDRSSLFAPLEPGGVS